MVRQTVGCVFDRGLAHLRPILILYATFYLKFNMSFGGGKPFDVWDSSALRPRGYYNPLSVRGTQPV